MLVFHKCHLVDIKHALFFVALKLWSENRSQHCESEERRRVASLFQNLHVF
jgi:hypothetical protein